MRTDAWQVAVRPDSLELRATSFQPLPEKSAPPFWLGWVITQMVELGVAALYLGILVPRLARRKAPGSGADGPVTGAQDAGEGSGPPAGEVNGDLAPSAAVPDVIANAERIVAEMAAAQSGQRFLPDNDLLTNLGKIFLINLLTYPAVWFFFPALRHFAADRERTIGWALLLFTWTLAGMLGVFLTLRSRPWRWVAGILTGLAASSGLFCLGIIALSAGYSLRGYQGPGLDLVMILLYAEIYAVLAEALLLLWYSRARIAWYHILALSLLMNLSSFLAGWLFLS